MPRYRFSWENLPSGLVRSLQRQLGLKGAPAEALRARYGARPGPELVRDAWPLLRDHWLPRDPASRRTIVQRLRQRSLGRTDLPVGTAHEELAYLRSCRNTDGLREIVVNALIAAGEVPAAPPAAAALPRDALALLRPVLAEGAAATDSSAAAEEDAVRAVLLEAFRRVSGDPALVADDDGDIPVRFGTAVVFVRVFGDPPIVRVFSPLLLDVIERAGVGDALNELNGKYLLAKLYEHEGVVMASIDLFARPLSPEHVVAACSVLGSLADELDEQLRDRFGGRTFFGEAPAAKPAAPVGGYL